MTQFDCDHAHQTGYQDGYLGAESREEDCRTAAQQQAYRVGYEAGLQEYSQQHASESA